MTKLTGLLLLAGTAWMLAACASEPLPRRLLFRVDVSPEDDLKTLSWDPNAPTKGSELRKAAEEALAEWRNCGMDVWLTTSQDPDVIPISFTPSIPHNKYGQTDFVDDVPQRVLLLADMPTSAYRAVLLHEFAHVFTRERGHPAESPILKDNESSTHAEHLTPEDCKFLQDRLGEG